MSLDVTDLVRLQILDADLATAGEPLVSDVTTKFPPANYDEGSQTFYIGDGTLNNPDYVFANIDDVWQLVQAPSASESACIEVTQAAHAFTATDTGKVFYKDATGVVALARSNSILTVGSYVLKEVVDANTMKFGIVGAHDIQFQGALTVGEYYYLSDAVAGDISIAAPTADTSYIGGVIQVLEDNGANNYKVVVRDCEFFSTTLVGAASGGAVTLPDFTAQITTTPGTPINVNHNLAKAFVLVTAWNGGAKVYPTIDIVDNDNFTVDTGNYSVVL